MKINFDIDCTPEEARRLMGLPDLGPVHDIYLDKVKETMAKGITPETVEGMIRSWAPMGEAGMTMMTRFFDQLGGKKS